jgi:hypothetical protein
MFKKISTILMAFTMVTAIVSAQEIKEDFTPSVLNQPGQQYPQVPSSALARTVPPRPPKPRLTDTL